MDDEIRIRALRSIDEMYAVEDLQDQIWPNAERLIVSATLQLRMARSGGIVLGAFKENELVGFVLGFLGTDERSPGQVAMTRLKHCSHKLGVHPAYRGQGIAYHLKLAQREAVLEQGVRLATWTFDPLVSENAHLNIRRLGCIARHYHPHYYGEMRDTLNAGLPSDRLEIEWWLTSQRVKQRISAERPALDLANFLGGGAVKINDAVMGEEGLQRPERVEPDLEATVLLLEIPYDLQQLKDMNMDLALQWRVHLREILQEAFDAGYIITDFVHIKGGPLPRSYYVLSQGDVRLG